MLEGATLRGVSRPTGVPTVAERFDENVDFAQLAKMYAKPNTSGPVSRPGCYKNDVSHLSGACELVRKFVHRS
jgi:hypothetical protein